MSAPSVPVFGRPHRHHRATDSTNARVRALAEAGAQGGLVVTADSQEAGRGRQGRTWFAPPRQALLYSALLRPLAVRPLLPLAVPLAVCEAIEALAPVRCQVKWPNDVWIEGRKVAGVLIEARPEAGGGGWAAIGIGLNVAIADADFPDELGGAAVSIGHGVSVDAVREALNPALSVWVEAEAERILEGFRERDALAGRRVAWEGGSGVCAGVDVDGHLIVDAGLAEPVVLGAGEVHLDLG